ncbi:hypothetical protein BS78_02G030100 [Paspalum vaginatum]|nr:hypothetical protein BS78_02G030100 [Paspalum vaginatum]
MPTRSPSLMVQADHYMAKESNHGGGEEDVVRGEEEEEDMLPGFRFHPTDEELVTFYLRRKVAGKRLSVEIIKDFDILKHDPWDIPKSMSAISSGEREWYFFCLRGRKYRNSIRPNRVTGSGFWKATGIDRPIYSAASGRAGGDPIGLKKSLVFYRGSAGKGTKTEWMMHEFRLPPRVETHVHPPSEQQAEVWTICRIFRRSFTYKQHPQKQKVAGGKVSTATVAQPEPDSGSVTGSLDLESDTGDEYTNGQLLPPPQAPVINNMSNGGYGYAEQFQRQWSNTSALRAAATAPLPPPTTMAAPNDMYHKDVCSWDDIGRMVMELTGDPSVFYDSIRYA